MKVSLRLSLADLVGESQPSALGFHFLYRKKAFEKLLLVAVGSESLEQKPVSHFRRSKASGKWVFPLMRAESLSQMSVSTDGAQKPEANGSFHW